METIEDLKHRLKQVLQQHEYQSNPLLLSDDINKVLEGKTKVELSSWRKLLEDTYRDHFPDPGNITLSDLTGFTETGPTGHWYGEHYNTLRWQSENATSNVERNKEIIQKLWPLEKIYRVIESIKKGVGETTKLEISQELNDVHNKLHGLRFCSDGLHDTEGRTNHDGLYDRLEQSVNTLGQEIAKSFN